MGWAFVMKKRGFFSVDGEDIPGNRAHVGAFHVDADMGLTGPLVRVVAILFLSIGQFSQQGIEKVFAGILNLRVAQVRSGEEKWPHCRHARQIHFEAITLKQRNVSSFQENN